MWEDNEWTLVGEDEEGGKDNDSLIWRTVGETMLFLCLNLIFIYFIIMLEAKRKLLVFFFSWKNKTFLLSSKKLPNRRLG